MKRSKIWNSYLLRKALQITEYRQILSSNYVLCRCTILWRAIFR